MPAPTEPEGVREDLSWEDVGPVDALGLEVGLHEGKLALFLQLTDAVAHAHRHLLVR